MSRRRRSPKKHTVNPTHSRYKVNTYPRGVDYPSSSSVRTDETFTPGVTWREFVKERMGPYMKKYGGHGPAMKQIGKEWSEHKEQLSRVKKIRQRELQTARRDLKNYTLKHDKLRAKKKRNNGHLTKKEQNSLIFYEDAVKQMTREEKKAEKRLDELN